MPELTTQQLTLALAIVAGVALVGVIATIVVGFRLRKVRREYSILRGDKDDQDVLVAVGRAVRQVEDMSRRVEGLHGEQQVQSSGARRALQKFGIVRYDAFDEMGGRLSFSAALLDDFGDGLVLTSINGRADTRTYVKPITALSSEHNLSEEEREAIAAAVANYGRSTTPTAVPDAR